MRISTALAIGMLTLLAFIGLIALALYLALYPAESWQFMQQYGIGLFIIMFFLIGLLAGAGIYWIKVIRIVDIDFISGGGQFIGILTEDPEPINIRNVLGSALPDAGITILNVPRFMGKPILMPVHEERGVGYEGYANRYGKVPKFLRFYGRFVTLDHFLASVYGLNINTDPKTSDPNDLTRLADLLRKVDKRAAQKYRYFEPYPPPRFVVQALKEEPTLAQAVKKLDSMRLMKRFYESTIAKLHYQMMNIGREISRFHESISSGVYKQTKATMQNMAIPTKMFASYLGVQADKFWRSGAVPLFESAPEQAEIAGKLSEDLQRTAGVLGYVVLSKDAFEELRKRASVGEKVLSSVEIEQPAVVEKQIKEVIRKAEGK